MINKNLYGIKSIIHKINWVDLMPTKKNHTIISIFLNNIHIFLVHFDFFRIINVFF